MALSSTPWRKCNHNRVDRADIVRDARHPGAICKSDRSGHIYAFTTISSVHVWAAIVTSESRRQSSGREVVLGRNAKGIGDTVEESEHRNHIHRLGNLFFLPAYIAELLHVLGSCFVSSFRDQLYIFQKRTLTGTETSLVKIALKDCFHALICGSLNTQEVSMTVQSIRTTIQERDVAGNHLF